MLIRAAVAATLLLFPAHDPMHLSDWIQNGGFKDPQSGQVCCGESDCKPVPDYGITQTEGGYYISESREFFPTNRVLWQSRDGRWWRCAPWENGQQLRTRCLIGPIPST